MTTDVTENYRDERVVLTVEGEFQGYPIRAYCCPDAEGRTFIDDGNKEIGEVNVSKTYGAPFSIDVVIRTNEYPQEGDLEEVRDELGDALAAQFDQEVADVYEEISVSDDPLNHILEKEGVDIIVDTDL